MKTLFQRMRPVHWAVAALAVAVAVQGAMMIHLFQERSEPAARERGWRTAASHQADPLTPAPGGAWDPFAEMDRMRSEMDQIMQQAFGRMSAWPDPFAGGSVMTFSAPGAAIDIRETDDQYIATVTAPEGEDAEVTAELEGQTLTIAGTQRLGGGGSEVRSRFQRTMTLPGPVEEGSMVSTCDNGVYTITIDKAR